MPDYRAPGVYVEETSFRARAVEGVSTTTTAFVGPTLLGPLATADGALAAITDIQAFEALYGGLDDVVIEGVAAPNHLARAVRAFFEQGGTRLYIARTADSPTPADYVAALDRLASIPDIALVAAPGASARPGFAEAVGDALVAHTQARGVYRFAILDPPPDLTPAEAVALRARWESPRAALIYPWLITLDPLATPDNGRPLRLAVPPSGAVCGLYAANDIATGVWKAPANLPLNAVVDLQRDIDFAEQEVLNPAGVNLVRRLEGRGIRLWGARTVSSDPETKYVSLSRYRLYLAASLDRGLQWAVFEPNGEALWADIRQAAEAFLYREWRSGALQGETPEQAYFVRCDRSTMTQVDIDRGQLVCLFAVAPVKPAEFVIARVRQDTADAEAIP